METSKKRPLINELTQGKELTNQLKDYLDKPMSAETCEFLVERILSSYEKALRMLNKGSAFDESPISFGEISPTTEVSDVADSDSKNVFKKRKTIPKWSEQVKVCSGTMVEGPLSDGYSWRKYGQKDILGANHPRAYYRCTHRNVQGCLATKQVQRSDGDSSVFEITYRGRHTCIQATQLSKALEKTPKIEKETIHDSKPTQKIHMERAFSFKSSKGVNTNEDKLFPSFLFDSTPIETEKLENLFYLGGDSTAFITFNHNLQSSDSDLSEMMNSRTNSGTNSPIGDVGFSLDYVDFNGDILFDITDFEM
ncbi:hypothetical protein L1887_41823 [Cichorium endivia]|nr:hypothetical protein L1887_41823 [Cichorium endivia]